MQEFKRFNGGESLTKDEFDFLDGVKNNTMAFFDVIPGLNGQKYLIVNFTKNSSLNERLKLVSDVYKIGYNKIDDEIVSRDITGNIVMEDIIKELAIILARSIEKNLTDDYSTILNYLKIDKNELMPKIKKVIDMQDYSPANKDNFRTLMETAENIIYSNLDPTRKKRLITLLNNDKFDNFMTSTHARMRFLTRNVLMNEENHNRQTKTLNRILEEQIDNLNNELLSLTNCRIYNYKNQESNKNGVRIKIGNTVMGLNPQGGIHTIYYTET